jgi:hypothetical protein
MQEEKRFVTITLPSGVTQQDLVSINKSNKLRNEQEILKLVEDYFSFTDSYFPIEHIGRLYQDFLENPENQEDYDEVFIRDSHFQIKELFLLLNKTENLFHKIRHSKAILELIDQKPL